nr:hypothetical protein Iba_chr10bCG10200 [Ipomoea batatas]
MDPGPRHNNCIYTVGKNKTKCRLKNKRKKKKKNPELRVKISREGRSTEPRLPSATAIAGVAVADCGPPPQIVRRISPGSPASPPTPCRAGQIDPLPSMIFPQPSSSPAHRS